MIEVDKLNKLLKQETVKRCVEQTISLTEQKKEKSQTHDVSL